MTSEVSPHVEALVLGALSRRVADGLTAAKAIVGSEFENGDKRTFRSPLGGERLGIIYRTDPDPEWRITDREALRAHLETFPGNFVSRLEIAGDEAEVLAVLHEFAPHLLREVSEVPEEIFQAALRESRETGQAVAPGIKRIKPGGVLTVKPDKEQAAKAIQGMVEAGLLTWDGRRALPEGKQTTPARRSRSSSRPVVDDSVQPVELPSDEDDERRAS